jgi:ABC-type uncharacterized transport system auxiliary subunit
MTKRWWELVLGGTAVALSSGCALTNKADPLSLRYFSPPAQQAAALSTSVGEASEEPIVLRVNRVEVASHLTETIAYRVGESEVGYYDTLRWTEAPEVYLERALQDALFSRGEMRRGVSDGMYTLNVALDSFEELKYGKPRVRVSVYVSIANDRLIAQERRLGAEVPVSGNDEVALAEAFGKALQNVAEQVRREVKELAMRDIRDAARLSELQATADGCDR